MSRRLGLVVGVNQYQDTTFHPLQYAENDARALAQWLVNVKGGKWSPPDVQLVQGEHATKELVESLLSQLCLSLAAPDDLLFIYFAGHAFVDERSGDGYLAFANTSYQDPTTALPLTSFIRYIMARCRAAHLLLVLDCYQTGPSWMMHRSSPYDFTPLLNTSFSTLTQLQGNRLLLCSCRGNEQAPEVGERNLGLFMYRTILGLCGPAIDPTTGSISLQQLHAFLSGTLPAQQQPQRFGQERYPLLLVGDIPAIPTEPMTPSPQPFMSQTPAPAPLAVPVMSGSQSEQPLSRGAFSTTATIQPPPQSPYMSSGQLLQSSRDMQRQQQSKYMVEQAQQYLQRQQPQEALNSVEQALQLDPTNVTALILKAQLLGTIGRFQEALAITEQLGQLDASNPLIWSMRAVILTNMGQYQPAFTAIERALALDAGNAETHAIKNNIMEHMAVAQSRAAQPKDAATKKIQRGGSLSFFKSAVVQIIAFGMGIVGALLPIMLQQVPITLSFVLESLGLALLCVVATRGAFRYGFLRFFFTLVLCIISALCVGGLYKLGYARILLAVADHPNLLLPFVFLAGWLALAAALPLALALVGLITGLVLGVRRK